MSLRTVTVASVLSLLGLVPVAIAPPATAGPDGCEAGPASYRLSGMTHDVAVTQLKGRYLPPDSSARGRDRLSYVQGATARARVDGHRAPRLGRQLTRQVERQLELDLVPMGSTTDDDPLGMRIDIRNDTDRNRGYALYRGAVTYDARVQRRECTAGGDGPRSRWREVGRWTSYTPVVQGVVPCGVAPGGPVRRAAQEAVCG